MAERLLFTCTQNAVRSVIAEALFQQLLCASDYQVSSCGVVEGAADGYAIAVMMEQGIDISAHEARSFHSFLAEEFDRIISFSAEAHNYAETWSSNCCVLEYWDLSPPKIFEQSREATLESYRFLCHAISQKLNENFI